MTLPSKAERIRALLDEGKLSTQEIADRIGCLPEYVRAVDHRRNPESWVNRARRNGDVAKARREGRWAYLKATLAGGSRHQGYKKYSQAYRKTMVKTGLEKASH